MRTAIMSFTGEENSGKGKVQKESINANKHMNNEKQLSNEDFTKQSLRRTVPPCYFCNTINCSEQQCLEKEKNLWSKAKL